MGGYTKPVRSGKGLTAVSPGRASAVVSPTSARAIISTITAPILEVLDLWRASRRVGIGCKSLSQALQSLQLSRRGSRLLVRHS